ncbi:MAG TPA: sulfite exporter TauE/SafE family protein [Candidatus Acidoferrales bacterium]|nr:sulfite exporter TauE/SafE family protein [Candidatus Acidoferrales bacterium]
MKNILLLVMLAVAAWFIAAWTGMARRAKEKGERDPAKPETAYHSLVGFVMCFFDTLGIGNFATTTSAFKFRGTVPDEKIPGTLNVGYALPTIAEALIYISIVEVDVWTLVLLIVASVAGAWLGAGVVARWSRRKVQIGMGLALLAAAGLMLRAQLQPAAAGGTALELRGALLAAGFVGNFALGALMTLGIGLYAPCLILVSLLGMNPKAAFPIMMGSCAFLMPVGGVRFIREGSYSLKTAVVMTLAGIPGVLIAAYIVRQLDLKYVRWLVVIVVVYAAAMMLRSAASEARASAATRT